MTTISKTTESRLNDLLDPGLPAVNPLDAWSAGGENADRVMEDCFAALLADPQAAVGAVVHDRAPDGQINNEYIEYLRKGHAATGKPVFLVSNRQGTGADPLAVSVTHEGYPVLDGLASFLKGTRSLLSYRDFRVRPAIEIPSVATEMADRWRARLAAVETLDEAESAKLLADFGLPMNPVRIVQDAASAREAAEDCGYPVVLKTAQSGIAHKSEIKGVVLGIESRQSLVEAYREMSGRLGPRALVAPMVIDPGVEMTLGVIRDEQFGPLVMLGFGGVHVETINDVIYALPPFDKQTARRLISSLRLRALLDGQRGQPPVASEEFCAAAASLSVMASNLADVIEEVDVNPFILDANRCIAVDALVVGRANHGASRNMRQVI